ncbi:MAG: hypothetical protein PHI98_11540 [Eubacteriales bacterium]|nr:hypothetical protein [Eubacteriales bacterium]
MMKRFLGLFLALCLALSMVPAIAEEETGAATNPYTVEGLGVTIDLPSKASVTNESATDEAVVLTIAMDGRQDTGFSVSLNYNEAYEGYTMSTLTDQMKQEIIDSYSQNYPSKNAPTFPDATDGTDETDEFGALFAPFVASGTGSDGNLYCIYVCILNGFILTTTAGINAKEFDEDAFGMGYNLYWQAVDMFYNYLESLGAFEE